MTARSYHRAAARGSRAKPARTPARPGAHSGARGPRARLLRLGDRRRALRHRDGDVGHHLLRLPRVPRLDGAGPRRLARGRDGRPLGRGGRGGAPCGPLPALYALWLLMGVAMAAPLSEPAFAAVVGWFRTRHRDRALLTVTLVAGLASTIFMPLEAWLLVRQGWRAAVVTLAVVLAVVTVPIHALVLRAPRPEPVARDGRPAAPPTGVSLAAARRTVVFWVLTIAFVVSNFATISVTVHLIPYLAARGWSVTTAAAAVGWIGAMQLPGRVFFAPVAAWVGHRWVTAAGFLAQGLALAPPALGGP